MTVFLTNSTDSFCAYSALQKFFDDFQEDNRNVGVSLVAEGYCTVAKRREKRLQKLLAEFVAAQDVAKSKHVSSPTRFVICKYTLLLCCMDAGLT